MVRSLQSLLNSVQDETAGVIDAAVANDIFGPITKLEICDEIRSMLAERAMHSIAYIHQL